MKVKVEEARQLADEALQKLGYDAKSATITSHHLIDSELRGYGVAGLARILSIADRLKGKPPRCDWKVTREALATAQIDGNDSLGYLVAHEATRMAIEKAKQIGISAVGANGTWYTGMLSYYAEMAAQEDLTAVIASNCTAWVAPEGGAKPMFGTNPYCIGFPSGHTPIIYDIGTSKIIHADILLAKRLGRDLPPGSALNSNGEPTLDPQEALEGAMTVWGGFRGSGLAIGEYLLCYVGLTSLILVRKLMETAVQLLGVLAGSPAFPPDLENFGFLIMIINPAMFRPIEEFKKEVDDYAAKMRSCPPLPGAGQLRMPFERSNAVRAKTMEAGEFEVEDGVMERLQALLQR